MKLFHGHFIYTVLRKIFPFKGNPKPGSLDPVTTLECFVRQSGNPAVGSNHRHTHVKNSV